MESAQRFDFYKPRSISEIINGTFVFIRQEFMTLGKNILFIVGPVLLISAIINNYYFEEQMTPDPEMILSLDWWMNIAVLWFLQLIIFALMILVVNNHVLLYVHNDESRFNVNTVFNMSIKDLWRMLLLSVVYSLIIVVGSFLFFIPGIYLAVSLSLVYVVLIHEKLSFTESLNRSQQLVREYWWFTLGVLLLTWLIVYGLQILFQIPMLVLGAVYGIHEGDPSFITDFAWWVSISTTLSYISYLFYGIVLVAMCVHYYSQLEKKEAAGLAKRIDQLGEDVQSE